MRALVVTNMYPSAGRPALGSFVRDQVRALRRIDGLDVQVRAFSPGGPRSYLRGCRDLRRRYAARASTSSTPTSVSWPEPGPSVKAHHRVVTLDGNDLYHPRSRRPATAVRGRMGLIGAPTTRCAAATSGAGTAGRPVAILACGVDVDFFRPLDRAAARQRLGLERCARYLRFPYDPPRKSKRADRARELSKASDAQLLTLGDVAPEELPTWVNAPNAVVCSSQWETFGLTCIAAVACDVPVLARPTRAHAQAMRGVAGAHCAEWDLDGWCDGLASHLAGSDPGVRGRAGALAFSAAAVAQRVADAWRPACVGGQAPPLYSRAEAPPEALRSAPPS